MRAGLLIVWAASIRVRNTVLQSYSVVESKELELEMEIAQVEYTYISHARPTCTYSSHADKDHQSPYHTYVDNDV